MIDDEVPLGAIASGLSDDAESVNSLVPWASAEGATATNAASMHSTAITRTRFIFKLDSNHPDFNMQSLSFDSRHHKNAARACPWNACHGIFHTTISGAEFLGS